MPGYQLELTVAYPSRPQADPEDYWRWAILDSLRRSLVDVDFRDDNLVRCGGGLGDDWYASYRDCFVDERCHLTYGAEDGEMRQMPIRHGVYALCRVAEDLRSARVRFVDDDRLGTGSTHRGVRALVHAFVDELEHRERAGSRWSLGGEQLEWPPVRARVSLSENWFPGRDVLLISDEGDAFVKEGACEGVAALARLIAQDLGGADDERARGLRTLADALKRAVGERSTPPPAVLVLTEEITAAELLVDQVRLRARLPVRDVDRCCGCGHETLVARPGRVLRGTELAAGAESPMIDPLWQVEGRGSLSPTGGAAWLPTAMVPADGDDQFGCRRCSSRVAGRRSVYLCWSCAQVLPVGLIKGCPRCHRELGGRVAAFPYYWFSPPICCDGARRSFQPGADPCDAVRR